MAQVVSKKCTVCGENNSKLLCYECNQELCEVCRPIHDKFSANKQHTIVDNRDVTCINYAEKLKCITHDQENRCFCLNCNSLICAECVIDKHKSHDVKSIKTMAYGYRMDLSKTELKVKGEMEILFNLKTCIQKKKKTLSEAFNLIERDLKSSIDDVQNIVKGVADEYIVTTKTHLIKQEDIGNSELQQVETTENGYKTFIKTLRELKKEKHDGSFVMRFKWMQDDMENLKEIPSVQSEEEFKSFERNSFLSTISNAITPRLVQPQTAPVSYVKEHRDMKTQIESLKAEKDSSMQSMVEGRKMEDNNPSISDLSDSDRPEKLSEQFREIYDNIWTDVLDYITETEKVEDDVIVKEIVWVLQCGTDGRDPTVKIIKDLVQESANRICDTVIQDIKRLTAVTEFIQKGKKKADEFVTKCSMLCLFMVLQDPPVVLDFSCKTGDPFNKDLFSPFISSGDVIDYLVWPVMFLSENGALMSKGIAQGVKKKRKMIFFS
ncbi:Hypothetical predicted protein [Mytilus galloprovincialis]|uniref:B box-type domain-containing protein n=1 Tax=Mytilus galloprovincialis TaxID=29158 RepID=A0A8B6FHY4_MYTGA|nr:Hypothetical predicted protein [Mytilus galloprovincialis]